MDIIKPLALSEISKQLRQDLLSYPQRVIYAGMSSRRTRFLENSFRGIPVQPHNIDPEPRDPDTTYIMKYKIRKAFKENDIRGNSIIVGADTRTLTPVINGDGCIRMVSRGKPTSDKEIFRTFVSINDVAERTGEQPWYQVQNSSGLLHHDNLGKTTFLEDKDSVFVMLKKEAVSYLATLGGINNYVNEFQIFYSQTPYDTNKDSITLLDLSAGISLPVLTKMGMIDNINGVNPSSFLFYKTLRHALQTVAVGISPELLEHIGIDSSKTVKHWDWINQVTQKSLGIL